MLRALSTLSFVIVLVLFSAGGEAASNQPFGKVAARANPQPRGIVEYYRALHKYSTRGYIPRSALRSAARSPNGRDRPTTKGRRQFSNVAADLSADGSQYCSPVVVGEGASQQVFQVDFDTGSGDFWVYSDLLSQSEPFAPNITHTVYNPFNSTTAQPTGQFAFIQYGSGNMTGIVFEDTVTVAGIQVKNQNVEAAIRTDPTLAPANNYCDGIFGLFALGNTTVTPGNNAMVLQDLFFGGNSPDQKVFTALLTRPTEGEGFYTFGSIDQDALQNQTINYVDVNPPAIFGNITGPPFWNVSSPQFFINGQAVENKVGNVVIDTGTTIILVNDDILPAIYEPVGGFLNEDFGIWVFPANFSQSDLPTVTLPVGGYNVTLSPEDIVFDTGSLPGFVIGGIQGNGGFGIVIFGDVWLRNVYAAFDLGSGDGTDFRFGFVPRAPNTVVGAAV
jgi:Eukaryotic aspartyl protease